MASSNAYRSLSTKCLYTLVRTFLILLAHTPKPILALLASFVSWLFGSLLGYRKAVVLKNLATAFPNLSEAERMRLVHTFYRQFARMILFQPRFLFSSSHKIKQHFALENTEVVTRLRDAGHKTIILVLGHCGCWEIFSAAPLYTRAMGIGSAHVYKRLSNAVFDQLEYEMRSRNGALSLEMAETPRFLISRNANPDVDDCLLVSFLADQSPWVSGSKYATLFFGTPTIFISGWESLARKLHAPVVYLDIRSEGKDRWIGRVELLTENAHDTEPFELVDRYATRLEESIRREPASWLWSHNRWKMDFEWIRPRLVLSPRLQTFLDEQDAPNTPNNIDTDIE